MAPKPKITREEILSAAYQLALTDGLSSLSSRNVAHAAGCSVQPIFSHFPTMEDLRREVYHYACQQSAEEVLSDDSNQDFLSILTHWMVDLARNRPNLFRLLYLSDFTTVQSMPDALMRSANHRKMINRIAKLHSLSEEKAEDVLVRSCIFLMGIGTIICINRVDLSKDQAVSLMRSTVDSFLAGVRQ